MLMLIATTYFIDMCLGKQRNLSDIEDDNFHFILNENVTERATVKAM